MLDYHIPCGIVLQRPPFPPHLLLGLTYLDGFRALSVYMLYGLWFGIIGKCKEAEGASTV